MGAETKKYQFEGRMLLEVRSTGAQSVVPPSKHPDNDLYRTKSPNHPTLTISLADLYKAAARTATAALFARHWQVGGRHEKTLALTGALLNSGWPDNEVIRFITAVVCAAKDDDEMDRDRACKDTIKRYRKGTENVTG